MFLVLSTVSVKTKMLFLFVEGPPFSHQRTAHRLASVLILVLSNAFCCFSYLGLLVWHQKSIC